MKEHAKEATTNAEMIVQPVEEWLNDVEKVLEDAQRLEERVQESLGCLSMTFNYSLAKEPTYEELLKAIQNERRNLIGVVGMRGSSKITSARVVGKQVEESKLFDKVVMTIVSQDAKVRDIQGQIADHLTFSLAEETELGRALRLSHR
ncbi:hypothetical protein JHK87_049535 [Glycine soja]|nr:hypothetical protein JHK87_049535 [Glycine soja]